MPVRTNKPYALLRLHIDSAFNFGASKEMHVTLTAPLVIDSIRPDPYGRKKDTLIARYFPLGIKLRFAPGSLPDAMQLFARRAVYRENEKRLDFNGGVVIASGEGRIFTPCLAWEQNRQRFESDSLVFLYSKNEKQEETILSGEGLEINDVHLRDYTIRRVKKGLHTYPVQ